MSESMSKIEEVARALCIEDGHEPDSVFEFQEAEEPQPPAWWWYEPRARVSIEAMRSLLDGDNLALILHDIDHLRGPMREPNATFRTFWNAAIDAALSEGRE